jgi:hypothetical protein
MGESGKLAPMLRESVTAMSSQRSIGNLAPRRLESNVRGGKMLTRLLIGNFLTFEMGRGQSIKI